MQIDYVTYCVYLDAGWWLSTSEAPYSPSFIE